ncbi:hypothetical protein HDV05_005379 [Chytridiales sp. JEL 0842]|nr:hypothetical protein HDV05_005379 [Chytridiales sp. JEL 0842]
MNLKLLSSLLLLASLTIAAPVQQQVTLGRRDNVQAVSGTVANNVATGGAIQENNINIQGTVGPAGNVDASKVATTSVVKINETKGPAPVTPQAQTQDSKGAAPSPANEQGPQAAATPSTTGNTLNIADTKTTNNVSSTTDNKTTNNINSNTSNASTDTTAAVAGNTVSGGLQSNNAATQSNTASTQHILGSIQNSNTTLNDSRNMTSFSDTKNNATYFQNVNTSHKTETAVDARNLSTAKTVITNNYQVASAPSGGSNGGGPGTTVVYAQVPQVGGGAQAVAGGNVNAGAVLAQLNAGGALTKMSSVELITKLKEINLMLMDVAIAVAQN